MRWLSLIALLIPLTLMAQRKSAFNHIEVEIDSTNNYSFWVSGHFYGNSSNTTGYPTNTLLGNIDMINQSDEVMLVCLGDLFLDISNDIPFYQKSLFTPLKKPLYNAVGNHDITDNIYQENFGDTYYKFKLGNDIHVVLDTELDAGDIEGDQLALLQDVKKEVAETKINNVFFYAHRTVWKSTYDELDNILNDNTQSLTKSNFEDDVLPILKEVSAHSKVFWFGGSIGGEAPVSFLYHEDNENKVKYIATAIRGLPRDAFLKVKVQNGEVSFETVSLTGQELKNIESYTVDYWENNSAREPFNWRLLPLYIKETILSWSFFFGILFGLSMIVFIRWVIIRKKKKLNQSASAESK